MDDQHRPPRPGEHRDGEVFGTFIIPNMFAQAARGRGRPRRRSTDAEAQIKPIFEKWRAQGLVGGAA